MRSRMVSLFLLLTLASCTTTTEVQRPWTLELATTGGIAGRGVGTIRIDSEGTATVGECVSNVPDLERFESLLAGAHAWRESYVPENRCCDRIEYTLTLQMGGKTHRTVWIDDPLPLPNDLSAMRDALIHELRERPCGSMP